VAQEQLTLDQEVVDLVTAGTALIEKAAAAEQVKVAQQKQIDELIPQAVAALAGNGFIRENQREKLAAQLVDPVRALELLIETAEFGKQAGDAVPSLGRPVSPVTKVASVNTPHVGSRNNELELRDSDIAMMRHFPDRFPQFAGQ
jgi:hypothetical protein